MKTFKKDGKPLATGGYADSDLKRQVQQAVASGEPPAKVAKRFEVHPVTVKRWTTTEQH